VAVRFLVSVIPLQDFIDNVVKTLSVKRAGLDQGALD